jgi:hypothetical protein
MPSKSAPEGRLGRAYRSLKRYITTLASSIWGYLSRFGRDLKNLKKMAILIAVPSAIIISAICVATIFIHDQENSPAFKVRIENSDVVFWNWDFSHNSLEGVQSGSKILYWGGATFYSTPVTMIFWGNATSNEKIYEIMRKNGWEGGDQYWQAFNYYAYLGNSSEMGWQDTCGVKEYDFDGDWDCHLRVYSGGYDEKYGYWCIATTHVEHFEKLDTDSQNPEWGEDYISQCFREWGYEVQEDELYIGNEMDDLRSRCDGNVTLIHIP